MADPSGKSPSGAQEAPRRYYALFPPQGELLELYRRGEREGDHRLLPAGVRQGRLPASRRHELRRVAAGAAMALRRRPARQGRRCRRRGGAGRRQGGAGRVRPLAPAPRLRVRRSEMGPGVPRLPRQVARRRREADRRRRPALRLRRALVPVRGNEPDLRHAPRRRAADRHRAPPRQRLHRRARQRRRRRPGPRRGADPELRRRLDQRRRPARHDEARARRDGRPERAARGAARPASSTAASCPTGSAPSAIS